MSSTGPEKNNSFIRRKSVNWVCVLHTLSQTPKGRLVSPIFFLQSLEEKDGRHQAQDM